MTILGSVKQTLRSMTIFFRSYGFIFVLGLFILSRVFIWIARPANFTEIIYSYMPYAHLWASGVKPYLEQFYEYPPATIPLFYIPHLVDMGTLNKPFHLDYIQSYRGLILLIDLGIFWLIWQTLKKTQLKSGFRIFSLLYLIAATAKAHHFIYDSIDWVFAGTLLLSAAAPVVWGGNSGKFGSWLGYWLGVATKLVNGPMGAILAVVNLKSWKKTTFWLGLTGLLVWGLPLVMYRSSLQVMLVFHSVRGLQVDSVGAVVARVADRFTHSETIKELYKNYEISGPISDQVLMVVEKTFPLALAGFVLFSWYLLSKTKADKRDMLLIHLTLGYLLVFMIFSKVLSTPFLLWHIPLVAVYPFRNFKTQQIWQLGSLVLIVLCMSPLPFLEWQFIHLPTWIHTTKALMIVAGLIWWLRESRRILNANS